MYEEAEQKTVHMLFEEFKKYEVPKGWKMKFLNGSEESGWPGSLDVFFSIRVTLEKVYGGESNTIMNEKEPIPSKEKDNAIL
jgi:hypothetical protein